MRLKTIALAGTAMLALALQPAFAADSVGYNRITVPGNSDARFSVPFTQDIVGTYTVSTKTASGVTVSGSLTAGAFANAYYVRFTSGNAAGLWSTITNNGTSDFTLADLHVLGLVAAGDSFRVYKHWTLGTVFPIANLGTSFVNGTKVLFFENNINAMSQNKAAVKSATFTTASNHWVGAGISDNTVLTPETQYILRNNVPTSLTLTTLGNVPDYSVGVLVAPNGDLNIGSGYPVPVVLKDSGMGGVNLRKVLFYDNSAVGQNKAAVKTATYSGGNWVGAGITGNETINPSESITFRLPAGESVGTKVTIVKPY